MTAVDLGSNTLRAVEIACDTLEPLKCYEKIVATADGLHETGKISEAAAGRIVEALHEARKTLDFTGPLVAVTTEAVRRASNAAEVLERIARESGIRFRVITGSEEAQLTLIAVKHRLEKLGLESENFVMADIGGGSTEILFSDSKDVVSRSFPVGIVTVAQKYGSVEKISEVLPHLMKEMAEFAKERRAEGNAPGLFVSTAGTPTTVAAMRLGMSYATYDAARINGVLLTPEELHRQMRRLMALDKKSRQELVGVGREDLIAAGILIFEHLFSILGFEESVVIDDGLREGAAIAACKGLLNPAG